MLRHMGLKADSSDESGEQPLECVKCCPDEDQVECVKDESSMTSEDQVECVSETTICSENIVSSAGERSLVPRQPSFPPPSVSVCREASLVQRPPAVKISFGPFGQTGREQSSLVSRPPSGPIPPVPPPPPSTSSGSDKMVPSQKSVPVRAGVDTTVASPEPFPKHGVRYIHGPAPPHHPPPVSHDTHDAGWNQKRYKSDRHDAGWNRKHDADWDQKRGDADWNQKRGDADWDQKRADAGWYEKGYDRRWNHRDDGDWHEKGYARRWNQADWHEKRYDAAWHRDTRQRMPLEQSRGLAMV
jgi:hypothetical protein